MHVVGQALSYKHTNIDVIQAAPSTKSTTAADFDEVGRPKNQPEFN